MKEVKRYYLPFLLPFLTVISLVSCETADTSVDQVVNDLSKQVEDLTKSVKQYTKDATDYTEGVTREVPKMAEEEWEKLFRIDYRVIELSQDFSLQNDGTPQKLEAKLNQLGKDRWDCFHLERHESKLLAFCRRRPTSYVRYMRNVIGLF